MLARNFLGAAQLGLKEKHYDALLKCLTAMETGQLHHVTKEEINACTVIGPKKFCGAFNMAVWNSHLDCGTVGCIGGTAELLAGLRHGVIARAAGNNVELSRLLYPERFSFFEECLQQHVVPLSIDMQFLKPWEDITVAQATQALQNYLSTGKANWREVLKTET